MTKKELKRIADSYKKLVQEVIPEKVKMSWFKSTERYARLTPALFMKFTVKDKVFFDVISRYPHVKWEYAWIDTTFQKQRIQDYAKLFYEDFKKYYIEEKLK